MSLHAAEPPHPAPSQAETLLISTDFDGTLLSHPPSPHFAEPFLNWLDERRKQAAVHWIINTGRDWPSLVWELENNQCPLWPDWVVLVEREIYRVENKELFPHSPWNHACTHAHELLFSRVAPVFDAIRAQSQHFAGLQIVEDSGSPIGIIAENETQADEIDFYLAGILKHHPDLTAVRNSIYFRFAHRDFNKGTALDEIGKLLDVPSSHRFTAGDHYNDLPMLDTRHARWLACPANAIPEVKSTVSRQGGFVSNQEADLGVAEALHHFFEHTTPA